MRQSHQKSRSRGRNRKPQNPMSRNYESNGPDVKIRGNASHIADKYSSLARDALSNGDTVMAENYWQHAEHYNRIIAAAQAQKAEENAAAAAANGRGPQPDFAENSGENSSDTEAVGEGNNDAAEAAVAEVSAEPKERKNGRGRRTRRAPASANGENGSDSGLEEASGLKAEADEQVSVQPEILSEDAAALPKSITGGLEVEES